MQINFKTVLAILPALNSTAHAFCYTDTPAWSELATKKILRAFGNSCERIKGSHAASVSTCDSARGDVMKMDGGAYFLFIQPHARGSWNITVDECLVLTSELHRLCRRGGQWNITGAWDPPTMALVKLKPQAVCCGCQAPGESI
ncbi:hypothetical protein DHEL01_v203925 [Diaporthe helianthi]|uniref:Cyanovirin-N domain-containing protein n=1 Tax=Diaporthe helianthi TaxID=158607 RepID=A0A2P5I5A6_DIAHE|nr:hypothetical protein DHEL01_v203925 [Diaporthe helianthi]